MLGRVLGAQAELERQVNDLRVSGGDSSLLAECDLQFAALSALRQQITATGAVPLASLRSEVLASVASAGSTVQQARLATASAKPDSADLIAASAATRKELAALHGDLFERRIFDRFLQFASTEEEEAYRRREAEARRYIEQQLSRKEPEGDLNAAGATMGQMLDAHAHGAGESPEFAPRWNRLVATTRNQREAMRAEGRSTEEFDRNLKDSVRRYLKTKGLTDTEIEAKLAVSADPLEAVKPFLKTEQDTKELDRSMWEQQRIQTRSIAAVVVGGTSGNPSAPAAPPTVDDIAGVFQAAGITSTAESVPATVVGALSNGRDRGPPMSR